MMAKAPLDVFMYLLITVKNKYSQKRVISMRKEYFPEEFKYFDYSVSKNNNLSVKRVRGISKETEKILLEVINSHDEFQRVLGFINSKTPFIPEDSNYSAIKLAAKISCSFYKAKREKKR